MQVFIKSPVDNQRLPQGFTHTRQSPLTAGYEKKNCSLIFPGLVYRLGTLALTQTQSASGTSLQVSTLRFLSRRAHTAFSIVSLRQRDAPIAYIILVVETTLLTSSIVSSRDPLGLLCKRSCFPESFLKGFSSTRI